jgi:hypothetical protein
VDQPKSTRPPSGVPVRSSSYREVIFPKEKAILGALVYADIFEYPLTEEEIFNYSIAYSVTCDEVRSMLYRKSRLENRLEKKGLFWFLEGRSHLVNRRRKRNEISRLLWMRAQRYMAWIAALPFIKMLAITGSMAMKNIASLDDDIDIMIVVENQRVFLVRSLVAIISRLARLSGINLCPNFIISEDNLRISDESLFTAHELVQLLPVFGRKTYLRLWKSNPWIELYLPNASPRLHVLPLDDSPVTLYRRVIEFLLRGKTGQTLDRWEHRRKLACLKPDLWNSAGSGAVFSIDVFKAHFSDHQDEVLWQYTSRLRKLGIDDPPGCPPRPHIRFDETQSRDPRKFSASKSRLNKEHL